MNRIAGRGTKVVFKTNSFAAAVNRYAILDHRENALMLRWERRTCRGPSTA
jgi:hypothetical protein